MEELEKLLEKERDLWKLKIDTQREELKREAMEALIRRIGIPVYEAAIKEGYEFCFIRKESEPIGDHYEFVLKNPNISPVMLTFFVVPKWGLCRFQPSAILLKRDPLTPFRLFDDFALLTKYAMKEQEKTKAPTWRDKLFAKMKSVFTFASGNEVKSDGLLVSK